MESVFRNEREKSERKVWNRPRSSMANERAEAETGCWMTCASYADMGSSSSDRLLALVGRGREGETLCPAGLPLPLPRLPAVTKPAPVSFSLRQHEGSVLKVQYKKRSWYAVRSEKQPN